MTTRPKLADLKKICPQDLAHCEGYVWHLGSRIGKGSFGEVYLGWNTDGTQEVAVKVVRKEFFKQDPKVRENLDREIRILTLLRGCEYVVHLHHKQELKHFIVLVMELCEYDLDHLVKVQPFKEDDITLFLHQLCLGMKALRNQNIVHRDLKPGNILIKKHPHTGKMMIKLADFGFARHFRDEGQKPIDMTSLAGTPVFMAPEALRCVFHPGEHYDDKVDIWSIGALLYKVIVGQCGFYAQLQDIPHILKRKGDAIAFERVHGRKVNYIHELPSSVNARLSEPFQEKMNTLLRALLRLDPTERMTFLELFEFVDDLITSKVEVTNLLHGTSFKIIFDPNLTAEQLNVEVFGQFGIPPDGQVVFSSSSVHYLSSHTRLTPQQFSELLDGAGGKQGHAILYLLPIPQVQSEKLQPDFSCLSKLIYAVDDPQNCVSLVLDHKFTDEIVHAINYLQVQQKKQLAGMEEFCNFCSRELERFTTQYRYNDLHQRGLQVLAKGGLAEEWLKIDVANLGGTSVAAGLQTQIKAQLTEVTKRRTEIDNLVQELTQRYHSCSDTLRNNESDSDLKEEQLSQVTATFADEAKRLLKTRKDQIHPQCKQLLDDCKQQVLEVTERVRIVLKGAVTSLVGIWEMMVVAGELEEKCVSFEQYLATQVPQSRGNVVKSLTTGTPVTDMHRKTSPGVVVTTPESQWPPHGTPAPLYYTHPPPPSSFGPTAAETESLKLDKEKYQRMYEAKKKDYDDLVLKVNDLMGKLSEKKRTDSTSEEEATLRPGALHPPSPSSTEDSSWSPADSKVLATLTEHLRTFCLTAEKLKPGLSASIRSSPPTPTRDSRPSTLYPNLNMDEYSVISMDAVKDGSAPAPPKDVQQLLPYASKLMSTLQGSMPELEGMLKGQAASPASNSLIKISKPSEYGPGDLVMFHPIKLQRSKSSAPMLLHLQRPKPYILMDIGSYAAFGIRPGRMPDTVLAKLTEKPRRFLFEEDEEMAKELGEKHGGEFFRVRAEPGPLKFTTSSGKPPARPPPPGRHQEPRSPGPLQQVFGRVREMV